MDDFMRSSIFAPSGTAADSPHLPPPPSFPVKTESFTITYNVPPEALPDTKAAVFSAGAGAWAQYTRVCAEWPVTGYFLRGSGMDPGVGQGQNQGLAGAGVVVDGVGVVNGMGGEAGEEGSIEASVQEIRVEIRVEGRDRCREAVRRLREVHPYEKASVRVVRLEDF